MLRTGVRRVLSVVSRSEGDLVRGNSTFRNKEKAIEDQYIRQKESEAAKLAEKKKAAEKPAEKK